MGKFNINRKILKPLNFIIPKSRKRVYALPLTNGMKDCYDLINYSADNVLCVVNRLMRNYYDCNLTIYLECFSQERIDEIKSYIKNFKKGKLTIKPILSHRIKESSKISICRLIKNLIIRYSCKYWISDSLHVHFFEKCKSQKHINLNYSTPFKKAQRNKSDDFNVVDYYIDTSIFTAEVHSAIFGIDLNKFLDAPFGFPRNDNMLVIDENKKKQINEWIFSKTNKTFKKIFVYAPTYRDYKGALDGKTIFGYSDCSDVEKFLVDNDCLVIAKLHPLQDMKTILPMKNVILYEQNYNFTLYDLLAESDCLISDYSSVMHDYILTDKPIIINLFDPEKYADSRGFVFSAMDMVFPSKPCRSPQELITGMEQAAANVIDKSRYDLVKNVFQENQNANYTDDICKFLLRVFKVKI